MRILAFNIAHDSAVCSLLDGKIEYFCKEERLSGVKRDKHPFKAMELYHSLNFGKIDHILYLTPSNNEPDIEMMWKTYIRKKFNMEMENYSALLHHQCHASLAYYNSGFKEALIFVIDRNGSIFFLNDQPAARESESVFLCNESEELKPICKKFWLELNKDHEKIFILDELKNYYKGCDVSAPNSLSIVKVYEAATTLIDQPALENGKTMGLSSYGNGEKFVDLFSNNIPISDKFSFMSNEDQTTCFYDHEKLINKDINFKNYQFYADKAKQVQVQTQIQALQLIQKYVQQTGIKNVCIVGGYGLNVVANNYYLENMPDTNFYFEPVSDDTGIPIGAAMLKFRQETKKNITPCADNFYHYYEHETLEQGEFAEIEKVCELLEQQKSVAIFEGNPEAGPRALGHRSILFDPRNKDCKKIVNDIKKREWYRPFAGTILKNKLYNYFEDLSVEESPHMTINFKCKNGTKELFPGIVHVDNTSRVQTCKEGTLYRIIKLFDERNDCPILLNTSFNLAGKPLVHSIKDAIETWKTSSLDAIYFVDHKRLLVK
jgi:carbamoyltransferase